MKWRIQYCGVHVIKGVTKYPEKTEPVECDGWQAVLDHAFKNMPDFSSFAVTGVEITMCLREIGTL